MIIVSLAYRTSSVPEDISSNLRDNGQYADVSRGRRLFLRCPPYDVGPSSGFVRLCNHSKAGKCTVIKFPAFYGTRSLIDSFVEPIKELCASHFEAYVLAFSTDIIRTDLKLMFSIHFQ